MQIQWRAKPEDSRFLEILIDGEIWREVVKSLFLKQLHSISRVQSLQELEEKFALIEKKVAKESAFRILAAKSCLSSEIRKKLALKKISTFAIESALQECLRLGYIDDAQELTRRVERKKARGEGPRRIAASLQIQGDGLYREGEQQAAIQRLLETRFRKCSLRDPKEKQKVIRALLYRGFDLETILQILRGDGLRSGNDC